MIDGVPQETSVDISAATVGNSYSASFTITDTMPGVDFKVQARALAVKVLPSLWATGTVGVRAEASPEVQSLTYDEIGGKLIIILVAAIEDAMNYETQLVVDGMALTYYGSAENDPAVPQPRICYPVNPQISGSSFQVRACC